MLGHVYVVEDAKDLAQIVRDVTRYGGAYRPEVCSQIQLVLYISFILTENCRTYMSSSKDVLTGKRSRKLSIKQCIISVSRKIVPSAEHHIHADR
jgi:hypothetical protein